MEAKVMLQVGTNSITVEGTEQFVKDQIDVFYAFCQEASAEAQPEDGEVADSDVTVKTAKIQTTSDITTFFQQFSPETPAATALILAGWLYSQRGRSAFDITELKGLFDEVGAPMPSRLDMSIRNMMRDGKRLFQSLSGGLWRPTVIGENYFKTEMKLTPGTGKEDAAK